MSYIGNSPGVASQRVTTTLTATAGQTQFTTQSGYVLGYVDVYLNGAKLVNGSDFEAITGTYITLFAGASAGDVVELISYIPRGLSDGYTKAEADAKFLDVGGDTATGAINLGANGLVVGTNQLVASGGNVGIGTASPSGKLHVYQTQGSMYIDNAGGIPRMRLGGGNGWGFNRITTSEDIFFGEPGDTGTWRVRGSGTISLGVGSNSTTMTLLGDGGNVGISTTNPAGKLDVNGSAIFRGNTTVASGNILYLSNSVNTASGTLYCPGGGSLSLASYGNEMIRLNEDNAIIFKVGSATERARIDSSGNLTIGPNGTANTNSSKLVVAGTISQTVGGTQYLVVDQSDIGTAQNQIPLNQYLGSMAFQDRENVSFLGGTGALSTLDITAISQQLNVSATDVFVYDTSKDSDGGAWRNRCQHTSWYNEQLNTATRGSRREFPAVAVIVATTTSVTIYDGDDSTLPMWMVFTAGDAGLTNTYLVQGGNSFTVAAINATLVVGLNTNTDNWGSPIINFITEKVVRMDPQSTEGGTWLGTIAERNSTKGYSTQGSSAGYVIPDSRIYDVAVTVLTNAPVDIATGLPVPTIAIGTPSGVSFIKHDGTVVNIYNGPAYGLAFKENNDLAFLLNDVNSTFATYSVSIPAANLSNTTTARKYFASNYHSTVSAMGALSGSYGITGCGNNSIAFPSSGNNGYGLTGLNIVNENLADYNKGMVSYITSKYNTGWLVGDIKGAWLSDTTQGTISLSNLVVNGDMSAGTGSWNVYNGSTTTLLASGGGLDVKCTSSAQLCGFYQVISGLTVGKTYTYKCDATTTTAGSIRIQISGVGLRYASAEHSGTGTKTIADSFIATSATHTLEILNYSTMSVNQLYTIDNVVFSEGEADRSINANGLQVIGTVTKTPVAAGSDLVGYSGFSTSNYFKQPPNSALDFGTGSYSVMMWAKTTTVGCAMGRGTDDSNESMNVYFDPTTYGIYFDYGNGSQYVYSGGVKSVVCDGNWHFIVCHVTAGQLGVIWVDGVKTSITGGNPAASTFINSSSWETYVGMARQPVQPLPFVGSLALVRVSGTIPSAEQIAKIYADEKQLFQSNAKATLYGTSDSVTALAYDDGTKLLHVGTSSGRSVFQGLRRVENTTTAVANTISAAHGLVVEN